MTSSRPETAVAGEYEATSASVEQFVVESVRRVLAVKLSGHTWTQYRLQHTEAYSTSEGGGSTKMRNRNLLCRSNCD